MAYNIRDLTTAENLSVSERILSPEEAAMKGAKFAGLTFLAAIASIIIPIAHFLTVPLGILATPIVGVVVYKAHKGADVIEGDLKCLGCGKNIHFVEMPTNNEASVTCKDCEKKIFLEKQA